MIDLQQSGQGLEGYGMLAAQLESLLADERDFIANAAQFSAFLFNQLDDLNWAGFYLNRDDELVLGPFQGQIACVRIPFGRGVCERQRPVDRPNALRTCMPSRSYCLRQCLEQRTGGAVGQGRPPDRRSRSGQPEARPFWCRRPGRYRTFGSDLPASDRLLITP